MFAEWICLQRHIILHTQPTFVCSQFRGGARIIGIRFKRFPRADWCMFKCWWKTRKPRFTVQADWPPLCRQEWHTDHLTKLKTECFIGRNEDRARHCGRWGMNHTWEQPCKEVCSVSWHIVWIWYLIWFGWWKTVIKNKQHTPLLLFIWLYQLMCAGGLVWHTASNEADQALNPVLAGWTPRRVALHKE